jgi:hypothetical protein
MFKKEAVSYFQVILRNFRRETKENLDNFQSGWLVSELKFEHGTSRTRTMNDNYSSVTLSRYAEHAIASTCRISQLRAAESQCMQKYGALVSVLLLSQNKNAYHT